MQQLLLCSLSFTLSCQHSPRDAIPLWGALAQVWDWDMGLGCGPKSIPGELCFQPLSLVVPERGEKLLGLFSKGQHHSSFQVLSHTRLPWGHPTPFGDRNQVP